MYDKFQEIITVQKHYKQHHDQQPNKNSNPLSDCVVHNIAENFVASPRFSGNMSFTLVSSARESMAILQKEGMLLVKTKIRCRRQNICLVLHTECNGLQVKSLPRQFFSSSPFPLSARSTSIGQVEKRIMKDLAYQKFCTSTCCKLIIRAAVVQF